MIAGILIGILYFVPYAEVTGKEGAIYQFGMRGIFPEGILKNEIFPGRLPMLAFWAASIILILVTIFKFKNRILQMKLAIINIVVVFILGALIFYNAWSGSKLLSGDSYLTLYFIFPFIAVILIYMAYRAIKKDELLVRSIDRIR
jgi:hypothetical protein